MSTIYLYLKQHSVTKLLYFGKTIKKNFESYKGSGEHWKNHIKKHGDYIDTLCVWEFDNSEECINFAIRFSKENNIVDSCLYANLILETGIDVIKEKGKTAALHNFRRGKTHTEIYGEEKANKMKSNLIKRNLERNGQPQIVCEKISITRKKLFKEGKLKSAPSQEVLECPKCGFKTTFGNAKRWHFDNCKRS